MKIGLYIHIPFCSAKCSYCDFASFSAQENTQKQYIEALDKEIISCSAGKNYIVDTVFIGGGTPSELYQGGLTQVIQQVKNNMDFRPVEFTVEANPESVIKEFVSECISLGANRFSLGLQTHSDKLLKGIRRHNFNDFLSAYNLIKSFGIENISADFMLGLPNQTLQDIIDSTKVIKQLDLKHLSAYALKVEEGTSLHKSGFVADDDKTADFYELICQRLESKYHHYEISNFAQSGYECKHNLKYWQLLPYLGVGLSASSYLCQKRYANTRDLRKYLAKDYQDFCEDTRDKFLSEYIMLGLRTSKGIDTKVLLNHGIDINKQDKFINYLEKGILCLDKGWVKLKKEYYFVMNSIVADLI